MASNTITIPKLLRNLKDHSKPLLQFGTLTYVRSNAEKLESSCALTEKDYKELCRLVMDIVCNDDPNTKKEETKALQAILKFFKNHDLKFFESALQISRDKRPKIFQFLRSAEDSALVTAALDSSTRNFIEDCMRSIDPNKMEWLLATSCTDNLQKLVQAETKALSKDDELEELLVCNAIALLQRLYKIASASSDIQSVQKFDTLVMNEVVLLAYMGHKRQRGPAISLLNQAIDSDLGIRMKMVHTEAWTKYTGNLQGPYTGRMSLLVKACELDWSNQWSISIQLLGTDLHRGATLINNLLSVEERAFKSTDTMIRRQAFVSWKLLIDNFALDVKELATPRRIKLLCVPLTAKNSKSEMIALTKLDVWWYLITKLYYHINKFADPVITQFLNFCFGPLGDTPLLSTKFDVIASPVKRFYKTKIVAIGALHQLLVRQEDRKTFGSVLSAELPNSVSETLFADCYKIFLHSVGEAIVIISQLHDSEMRNRDVTCQVLWRHLMQYIQSAKVELKKNIYNELILVITELKNRASSVPFINSFIRDVILDELATVAKDLIYHDKRLIDLMTKIMVPSFLKFLQAKHCESLKSLMWQTVRPETSNDYHPETLRFLETTLQQLRSVPIDPDASIDCFELWFVYADIASKFMKTLQSVNEGTAAEPDFKTLKSILSFPFTHMHWANSIQAQRIALHWKDVYKKFECQADVISSIKPNEILDNISTSIQHCLTTNDKCHRIAVYCLDALLSTINYKSLLAQNKIPPLVHLIGDLTTVALHEGRPAEAECALRALSSLLITVYGHSPDKALAYMKATSQTIELMLKTDADDTLAKEIVSTWETIVSIMRGLNILLDHTLLVSYKQIISLALRHTNPEISSQAQSILEMKDSVRESARAVLVELAQEWTKASTKKDTPKNKLDKGDRTPKSTKITGSFLNRGIPSSRLGSGKTKEKEEKKLGPLPPEPDSQDYVLIRSEVKVDVTRLTEHQKESLKRRRDDIPALYNDLSQSSSQNTQDLQQWFDGKKKRNEPTIILPENEKSLIADEDPNKENKIDTIVPSRDEKLIEEPTVGTNPTVSKDLEDKCSPDVPTPENLASSGQDLNSDLTIAELSKSNHVSPKSSEKEIKELQTDKSNTTPSSDSSYVPGTNSPEVNTPDTEVPIDTVAKQLNFESRDEYPDEKNKEEETMPATSSTTPALRNDKVTENATSDEPMSPSQESSNSIVKAKVGRPRRSSDKFCSSIAQRVSKRKQMSGTDTDDSDRDKKRKKLETPDNAESSIASMSDKRSKVHEINRLRIDMVFDGPPPPRRRSKYKDDIVGNDTVGKGQCSPEVAGTRGKIVDTRKSVTDTEKKETVNSEVTTKRRRRSIKVDADAKSGTQEPEETQTIGGKNVRKSIPKTKKNLPESGLPSESQIIVDDEESVKPATPNDEKDKSASQTSPTDDGKKSGVDSTETPTQNDLDDIVESSQECTGLTASHRRSVAKTSSPIISNDPPIPSTEPAELPIVTKQPLASSPLNSSDQPQAATTTEGNEKVAGDDSDETFLDISAIRPQLADDVPTEDAEKKAPEASKTNANPTVVKVTDVPFNFSSPKGQKRLIKSKTFSSQGRAAHMIGLVTKLPIHEKDPQTEIALLIKKQETQKNRWKDMDMVLVKGDRQTIVKEPERIGSPSGSRQQKIFNNMKAADFASSTPPKLFGNLKNDGEKISPNMDRTPTSEPVVDEEASGNEEDGRVTPVNEASELPMLEWSSANPPSLTASPSASILKRGIIDLEPDATVLSKLQRKRVSFADPPVSKEMGYEIETFGSPHKISKYSAWRYLFDRKHSPTRLKQQRFKMIQIDLERVDINEEPQTVSSTDIEMERERDNALLIKIAEDLEESIELQNPDNNTKNANADLSTTKETVISGEMENSDSEKSKETSKNVPLKDLTEKAKSIEKNVTVEESQTQDDLFNSSDEKLESSKGSVNLSLALTVGEDNTSGQNSTLESFALNVTEDSIVDKTVDKQPEGVNKLDSLDDTMDAADVLSLNCTMNSDVVFCGAAARSSTKAGNLTSEMDTLPVTDSLLNTQDSQEFTQPNIELARPELLNSTDPIYPKLINCQEPVDKIIDDLTNPLWHKNLAKYLQARSIRTVGDLARLSEREIHRIPVKGSSKIDFVRKVLDRYEQGLRKSATKLHDDGELERLAGNKEKEPTSTIANDTAIDELPGAIRKSLGDISALRNMSNLPSNCTTFDASEIESQSSMNNTSSVDRLNPHFRNALERTSTKYPNLTIDLDPTICTVLDDTTHLSQISTINLSTDLEPRTKQSAVCSTQLPEKSTKCVGSETKLEELLDEMDVDLVLQSAVKRTNADKLLAEYKLKMDKISEAELCKDTMTMLGIDDETMLKLACHKCGLDKVLRELPDIFNKDKQFYFKVINAYCNKIRVKDRNDLFNRDEIKVQFCRSCTTKELLEILTTKLKEEELRNVNTRIVEAFSLDAILRRVPVDLIVNNAVANAEIVPPSRVLDTALIKNDTETVTRKIFAEYPEIADNIFEERINPDAIVSHIKETSMSREELLSVHEVISAKLSPEDLLNAYHEAMKSKLSKTTGKNSSD